MMKVIEDLDIFGYTGLSCEVFGLESIPVFWLFTQLRKYTLQKEILPPLGD